MSIEEGDIQIKCLFCGNTIIVPEELRIKSPTPRLHPIPETQNVTCPSCGASMSFGEHTVQFCRGCGTMVHRPKELPIKSPASSFPSPPPPPTNVSQSPISPKYPPISQPQ